MGDGSVAGGDVAVQTGGVGEPTALDGDAGDIVLVLGGNIGRVLAAFKPAAGDDYVVILGVTVNRHSRAGGSGHIAAADVGIGIL